MILIILVFIPNLAFSDDFIESNSSDKNIIKSIEISSTINNTPNINARHAVVIDRSSKNVLYGKKEYEKCKMASTTKIMTAIVVLENSSLNDLVLISKNASSIGGSRLGLCTNDQISVYHLLYGLLLCSGNDAAIALSEHVARKCRKLYKYNESKGFRFKLKFHTF